MAEGATPSPLGRYAPPDAGDRAMVDVRLLRLPVRLLAAAREHHDGVMREFRLMAMSGSLDPATAPARLVELTEVLGVQYAQARARPDAEVDEALARGDRTIDLTYRVPASAAHAVRQLDALMTEADEFCRQEQLMSLPRSPLLNRFAAWYLEEFLQQIGGGDPVPWDGPLDLQ